jgi:hypothetical protein
MKAVITLDNNVDSGKVKINFYIDNGEIVIISVNSILAEDLCCGYCNRIKRILARKINETKQA